MIGYRVVRTKELSGPYHGFREKMQKGVWYSYIPSYEDDGEGGRFCLSEGFYFCRSLYDIKEYVKARQLEGLFLTRDYDIIKCQFEGEIRTEGEGDTGFIVEYSAQRMKIIKRVKKLRQFGFCSKKAVRAELQRLGIQWIPC